MKVLIIAPPILKDQNDPSSLLTVPPIGYGGVENVIYALVNGLVHLNVNVTLIGVPGSRIINGLEIIREARNANEIRKWISENRNNFDVIHDHSCGLVFNRQCAVEIEEKQYIATHHQTGISPYPRNTVYLSFAQRSQAKDHKAHVIRIPVMINDYLFHTKKEDYFLYMGRISEWKGVYEAASFSSKLGAKLIIAGPAWEPDYLKRIEDKYSSSVSYVGNVSGLKRIDLLAKAKAVFILSRFTKGPWGDNWCEPGATIVSEACASGTSVISSTNGCLSELVVPEIGFQLTEDEITNLDTSKFDRKFPEAKDIRNYADKQWSHLSISREYIGFYKKIMIS